MREDVLHHIWKFRSSNFLNCLTTQSKNLSIISVGQHNTTQSGPDFFNAKLEIEGQLWAGNVEIHIQSSHWYAHKHEQDAAYDNVILHVVWSHDAEVFRKDGSVIPTLELEPLVSKEFITKTQDLLRKDTSKWIPCEKEFPSFDDFTMRRWLERLYLERLEDKAILVHKLLNESQNDWEAVLFQLLLKNFGLNVNGEYFLDVAVNIPFNVIRKVKSSKLALEALLFGQANLIEADTENAYAKSLYKEYSYLAHKFKLKRSSSAKPQFFRLRPPNFPTIRLSQIVSLYHKHDNLIAEILKAEDFNDYKKIFEVSVTEYWKTHHSFDTSHSLRQKGLSKKFIDLVIINTVAPLLFVYNQKLGKSVEHVLNLMSFLPPENNTIVKTFNEMRKNVGSNAMDTQALLQLKQNYCDKLQCLNCELGLKIVK